MNTWIVIPAYNEEKTVGEVVRAIKRSGEYQIVVVSDGSHDATERTAYKAGAYVLSHAVNRGQGAALATGTQYAMQNGAESIVHFDADGQHVAETIPILLAPLKQGMVQAVLGSRFLNDATKVPLLKKWLILKPAILFTQLFSGIKVTDTHNGLRALTREAAEKIEITHDRMAHASEILDEISKKNITYVEVPVTVVYHTRGQGFFDGIAIMKDIFLHKIFHSK